MYFVVPPIVVDCSFQPQVVVVAIPLFAFGCKGVENLLNLTWRNTCIVAYIHFELKFKCHKKKN
jgi:hypothetical protein